MQAYGGAMPTIGGSCHLCSDCSAGHQSP